MDVPNTVISVIAAVVAIAAFANSHRTTKIETARRNRDLLSEVISANYRLTHAYEAMRRERNKTGPPIQDYEKELFDTIEELVALASEGNSHLENLLSHKYPKIDAEFHATLLMAKTNTNDMAQIVEIRLDRFKRFNDNRVKDLVSAYTSIANRA
jgi:hypothetical protein